jgi:hypothetical protein
MEKNEGTVEVEENLDLPEVVEGEEDTTDWKAEAQKLREKAIAQRERTKALKGELKEAKAKAESTPAPKTTQNASKADGLDETALDYLDVKGVTDTQDIKVVEDIVKKTGMTVREALKDDYVVAKLAANKAARDVKDAMPSGTKRSGGNQGVDLSSAVARYEASGYDAKTLPDDYVSRTAIINAVAAKHGTNKPAWH